MASAVHPRRVRRGRTPTLATWAAALVGVTLLAGACSSDSDADTAATDAPNFDTSACEAYVGVWEADEEAGSEDEVGGIYRAQLQLPASGEASWAESDFIEVWESWSCVGSEIIGFSDSSVRWIDGEQVTRDPNPCQDLTTSAPRPAVVEDDTIVSSNTWVRCRGGRLEEGAPIATIADDGTLTRNGFTLLP